MKDRAGEKTSAILWRATTEAATRGFTFIRFIVLAMILTPDDFGLLAIATVSVALPVSLSKLGMVQAAVQHAHPQESHYNSMWTVGFIRGGIITAGLCVAAPLIGEIFKEPRAIDLLRAISFLPLIQAAESGKIAKLIRSLRFRSLALIAIPPVLIETLVAISLAPKFGFWAIAWGALWGASVRVVLSYILAPYRPRFYIDLAAASSLFRFGRWIFITGLIGALGTPVLRAVISRHLGAADLGLFYFATRLAYFAKEGVSAVVADVSFPLYARLQSNKKQVRQTYRATLSAMLALLAPTYALLIALAPSLVGVWFGPKWTNAVGMIQILAVAALVDTFVDATNPMLMGIGRPERRMATKAIRTVVVVLAAWSLTLNYGLVGAAVAVLLAELAGKFASAVFAKEALGQAFTGLVPSATAIAFCATMSGVVSILAVRAVSGTPGLILAIVTGLLFHGLLLWKLDRKYDLNIAADVLQVFPWRLRIQAPLARER